MAKSNKTLLNIVCDYKAGGLEFAEIRTKFQHFLNEPDQISIQHLETPPLDTMALGFTTAQLALSECDSRVVIYGNAAPRKDKSKAVKNNVGQGIKYAKLENGVEIINVNSEFAFGFLKEKIVEFRDIDCPNSGSQFRSRDFFPERVSAIVNNDYSVLGEELDVSEIPDIPNNLISWTDGFGNIKTSMRKSDLDERGLKSGQKVKVKLNGVLMIGVVATGGFSVDRGVLAINIGSSGHDNPFVELFLRVHKMSEQTAAVRFGYPVGGTEFSIEAL